MSRDAGARPPIEFRSDNAGRAAPELIAALAAANEGTALGYGMDPFTERLQQRFAQLFERPVQVFPVPTGTAANALALASVSSQFGAIYCSVDAHINTSECNATGFFSAGGKLVPVASTHGKIDPGALETAIATAGVGLPHKSQPSAVNVVQVSDVGVVYQLGEIEAVSRVAHAGGLKVHMDGARLANAVAHLRCSPAQATWRAGVDILSFGVTKNGGLLGDAIVVFDPQAAQQIRFHLRRAGLVWSKMRFASAQILAYVEDDLWLRLAAGANEAAARIAAGLSSIPGVTLLAPVQANELFIEMAPAALDALERAGILYYRRAPRLGRFVCRWDTSGAEVDALLTAIKHSAAAAA